MACFYLLESLSLVHHYHNYVTFLRHNCFIKVFAQTHHVSNKHYSSCNRLLVLCIRLDYQVYQNDLQMKVCYLLHSIVYCFSRIHCFVGILFLGYCFTKKFSSLDNFSIMNYFVHLGHHFDGLIDLLGHLVNRKLYFQYRLSYHLWHLDRCLRI